MPFPPKKDDSASSSPSQGSGSVSKDHTDNSAHNAPASGDHKSAMQQSGMTPNDAHKQHGDGHH